MECFRVIIAGGRDFTDYGTLEYYMDRILSSITQPIVVVCGKARGVDTLGSAMARNTDMRLATIPQSGTSTGNRQGLFAMR